MAQTRAMLDLLRRTDRQFARTQHRYFWIRLWVFLLAGPLYLFVLGVSIFWLLKAWHGGDWFSFWIPAVSTVPIPINVARIAIWRDSRAHLFAPVAALREAARTGDDKLAPVSDGSSDALEASALLSDRARIGPLRRPIGTAAIALVVTGLALLSLPVFTVPFALANGGGLVAVILVATCLPIGAVVALLGWSTWRSLYVRADDEGVSWHHASGWPACLRWRDVRAFHAVTYPRPLASRNATQYVVDGGKTVLAWRLDETSMGASAAASAHLRRIITERTGLSLRNLSAEAMRIAYLPDPDSSPRLSRDESRRRLRVVGIALLPSLVLAGVGGALMVYQPWYYGGLYAQSHAHAPLYADALATYGGDWPVTDHTTFVGGAYQLEGGLKNDATYVLAPHVYNNALVEVMARTNSGYDLSGVGLAIQGQRPSAPLLAFEAAPDGSWWLYRVPPHDQYDAQILQPNLQFNHTAAIHRGFGADNRIGVLVRGGEFTFYVNGQYATDYQDDTLAGGRVGLYLDPSADSGSFRDFAVYPLN